MLLISGRNIFDMSLMIIAMPDKYLVFTGRPNAGKSSLIKEIIGLNVKIGKRPGTTRNISKHPLSQGLILVDMPGFGRMLGASKRLGNMINDRIIHFLETNAQNIVLTVHVLDISTFLETTRRLEENGIISVDVEMVQFLAKTLQEFPLVVANKIDKADKNALNDNLKAFIHQISNGHISAIADKVFPVSAKTGEGINVLKNAIHEKLVAKGYRTPFKTR